MSQDYCLILVSCSGHISNGITGFYTAFFEKGGGGGGGEPSDAF